MTNAEIASWITRKDDCCAFQDIACAVRCGDIAKARSLATRYRSWLSDYEVEWFIKFGLL